MSMTIKEDYHASATSPLSSSSSSLTAMQQSASGSLDISGSGSDKGSIVFTIVELLLIALLLLCNCLNLVSVLGFGVPQAKASAVMGREGSHDEKSMIDDFEAWQSTIVSGEDEVNKKLVSNELIAIQDYLFNENISSRGTRM